MEPNEPHPSFYTVVQYVPDLVADERVNVGVLVFQGNLIRSHFLRSWKRVQAFGGEDVTFLRDLAQRVKEWSSDELTLPGTEPSPSLNEEALMRLTAEWRNAVQFTPPRGSVLAPDELLTDVASRFLREQVRQKPRFRDRPTAAKLAATKLRCALQARLGEHAKAMLKRNLRVPGALDEHLFDVTVMNGEIRLAAQALSFEGPHTPTLEREVKASAWAVDDIRNRTRELELAVVALPPRTRSKTYDHAAHVITELGATFVAEQEADVWANRVAELVAAG
ncbi:MAG TPA: DUF3037 domain-containing protein [Actinomycetes bacterium]|nr:DUF3037 domain-containing protein [Actinomycetes bacterium]